MELLMRGGILMWPLLGISIVSLAVIIERCLFFAQCRFPARGAQRVDALVRQSLATQDVTPLIHALEQSEVLQPFAEILRDSAHPNREAALQATGEGVLQALEKRLSLLRLLGQTAPLLGLLGTVIGMINTFARIASAASGVDMGMLADGIWQALITTAAGISIAIPVTLCVGLFQSRTRAVREALTLVGNAALTLVDAHRK